MKNRESVIEYCQKNGIEYEILISEDLSTSKKASEKLNMPLDKVAKTVIFIDNNENPWAVIVKAIYKIRQKPLARLLGLKYLRLAKREEVIEYTGYVPGGVCPLDLPVKTILDKELLNEKEMWFGGGDPQTLIKIKIEDLVKFQSPIILKVPKVLYKYC